MHRRFFFPGLFCLAVLGISLYSNGVKALSFADGKTLVLYDASSGAIPSETLMDFTDFPPGAASLMYSGDAAVMDTTQSGGDAFAGWVSSQTATAGFPVLDRAAGVQVNFTLQVENERHARNNRAGFSLILLDREAKGIELSFWENEIWAQSDELTGGLFRHGEGVPFATSAGLTDYQVTITRDIYTLFADAEPILSGPVRDYSGFDGFPDPYETPNFLFLGDDTRSAQARIKLRSLSITGTEPILPKPTDTSTSTSSPLPTASFTPPPSATPVPTATTAPTGKVFQLCSSGWLFVAMMIGALSIRKIRG